MKTITTQIISHSKKKKKMKEHLYKQNINHLFYITIVNLKTTLSNSFNNERQKKIIIKIN